MACASMQTQSLVNRLTFLLHTPIFKTLCDRCQIAFLIHYHIFTHTTDRDVEILWILMNPNHSALTENLGFSSHSLNQWCHSHFGSGARYSLSRCQGGWTSTTITELPINKNKSMFPPFVFMQVGTNI